MAWHRRNTPSKLVRKRMMVMASRVLPNAVTKPVSSMNKAICPKLKKKMMKTVEIRIALARCLISRKLIRKKLEPSIMEKIIGRIAIFASTSRRFQASNARLG